MILFIRQVIGGWFVGIGLILVLLSLVSSCEGGWANWSFPNTPAPSAQSWENAACGRFGPAYGSTLQNDYGTPLYTVYCQNGVQVTAAQP